eukprot:CAMPEP_0185186184 /NCGR_PEP_ID=MMETSP1140-20130426/3852_1 /TAXON_ID=298111 /ORGANISM="Pavlova sp., Strain CCMP459" /LENGTH=140 /DNA_ID=CAMNT_0027752451 /DNA_START=259 /DNA_END=680 /DNA_ORIENTATION=+
MPTTPVAKAEAGRIASVIRADEGDGNLGVVYHYNMQNHLCRVRAHEHAHRARCVCVTARVAYRAAAEQVGEQPGPAAVCQNGMHIFDVTMALCAAMSAPVTSVVQRNRAGDGAGLARSAESCRVCGWTGPQCGLMACQWL